MEQSRSPYPKLTFPHRQAASCSLAQPRDKYCASMLLKHSWPHEARALNAEEMLVVQTVFVVDVALVVVGDVGGLCTSKIITSE